MIANAHPISTKYRSAECILRQKFTSLSRPINFELFYMWQELGGLNTYLYLLHAIKLSDNANQGSLQLICTSAALHFDGIEINKQALIDNKNRNILLLLGQVFDGLNVEQDENDTLGHDILGQLMKSII